MGGPQVDRRNPEIEDQFMKSIIPIALSIAALFAQGCSTAPTPNPAPAAAESAPPPKAEVTVFEGSWIGHDASPGQDGSSTMTVSGHTLKFHGADVNDWLTGTFILQEDANPKRFAGVVMDCGNADYIGKKCCAIYKIESGALTVSGYEPGVMDFPVAFDDPKARQIVFKHNQ
jgi:uncharacterized protein (TIGR03067 family)